uniref:Reticuline oxidase-like protein n=1 Tax=Aegilops tauschii TaxID=37682 RepID=M8CPH9_AEGTA
MGARQSSFLRAARSAPVGDALSTRLLCELLLLVLRCFSSRWLPPVPERQDTQLASSCTRRAPPTSPTCWHPPSGTPSSSPTPRRGRSASSRPSDASHVQSAVLCGRGHGVRVRVRSGGHDYEGLSYRSVRPSEVLAVVDLGANLRAVRVNRFESTAWVDSGAPIGELYYAIDKNDSRLAVPAGDFGRNGTLEEALLSRTAGQSSAGKIKSDYVRRAIPKAAWEEIFSWFTKDGAGFMMLEPHGGFMGSVPAAATPYPHRHGVLYVIQYIAFWQQGGDGTAATTWIGGLYDLMEQHVSKNPRRAYVNFRDLDIGQNDGTPESGDSRR